uniref:Uncharacterized protein n=1 Tax=Rhizophora mucronata TaxID=61149 RepID=A0A2P2JN58_RHIMU
MWVTWIPVFRSVSSKMSFVNLEL